MSKVNLYNVYFDTTAKIQAKLDSTDYKNCVLFKKCHYFHYKEISTQSSIFKIS